MNIELLIDGERVPAHSGRTFDRLNPVTDEVAATAAACDKHDAKRAVESAHSAFGTWSTTGPAERRTILAAAADVLQSKSDAITGQMTAETGATGIWGGFNVKLAAGILREAAALTSQIGGEVIPADKPNTLAMSIARPKGVCIGIAPWNAPVILGTRAIAVPIACGNSVVLKASELCPGTHSFIAEALHEAGLPKGVLTFITNAPHDAAEVVESLIAHPHTRHVNFTGSTKVGRIIAKLAAEQLKPALLELGGKAPLLILDDADIEAAVNATVFGAFMNQGQICMSTERIIVDKRIADEFVARLSARAAALPFGDPRENVVLGSLIDAHAAEKMEELIDDAISKGATLACGGERNGTIVAATVLDHVTRDMRIYREESFGPVKPVIRVDGDQEAIEVANDTEYGLSSAVYSADVNRAMRTAGQIESGICHINGPTVADEPQMPFGGVKSSGYGRFGGRRAIAEFTDTRWITIEDPHQHYPF